MNKWALILGASSGFGAEACLSLAKKNINIFGVHLDRKSNMDAVNNLKNQIESFGVETTFLNASANDPNTRLKCIEYLKNYNEAHIKIFLHSLAFGSLKPLIGNKESEIINQKQIEMTLDIMANSLVYWTQDLYKSKLLSKGSHILAMTSSGNKRQWQSYGAVSATKCALESYIRQLSLELAPMEISCNSIQAGGTDTPALRKIPGNIKMIENAIKNNPSKRLTTTNDIAKFIALLVDYDAHWMTGNTIRLDGGEDLSG